MRGTRIDVIDGVTGFTPDMLRKRKPRFDYNRLVDASIEAMRKQIVESLNQPSWWPSNISATTRPLEPWEKPDRSWAANIDWDVLTEGGEDELVEIPLSTILEYGREQYDDGYADGYNQGCDDYY